jgi:uncharacterized protein YdaU (DUF1376 family)
VNYYEHHLGDYAEATGHLSFVEDAAYSRMMRKAYATEKPLPADVKAVQRLVGARSKEERDAVDAVLAEFWVLHADGWHNDRCDAEIARYQDKQRKAKASAEARWTANRPHSEGNANASPNAMRTHSEGNALQTPDTKHQTPPTESKTPRVGRGSRLPPDWDPGETGFAFASQHGLTNGKAIEELARFRDFWAAKAGADAVKADWQATWRNWVRKAMEFSPKGGSSHRGSDDYAGPVL